MRASLVKVAIAASAALVLASCAMPADDPNYNANAGLGGDSSAAASAAAEDQAALDSAIAAPTSIGVDAPLAGPVPADISIVSLTDGSEYEGVFETALAEAGGVLNWVVETVPVDMADPASIQAAFDAAVAKKAGGIHITGAMADSLLDNLTAAEAAGVPVICTGCSSGTAAVAADATAAATEAATGEATAAATEAAATEAAATEAVDVAGATPAGITDASIDGTAQNVEWGNVLSTYVVANQYAGEDAGVQVFVMPGGALNDFNSAFDTNLLDLCRNCSSTQSVVDPTMVDLTDPAAIGTFVDGEMAVSLGAWALLDTGSLSNGVADTLAADPTLLAPVTLIGRGAAASDIAALQALGGAAPGATAAATSAAATSAAATAAATEAAATDGATAAAAEAGRTPEQAAALQAWIAIPQPVMAWRVIDQFARIIGGEPLATGPLPSQLLTGANAADAVLDANGNYIGVADYQDQFKALWGVK